MPTLRPPLPHRDVTTCHFEARRRHRNAPADAKEQVLAWGRAIHQFAGRVAYFVGTREVALAARSGVDLGAYDGLAVVQAADGALLTLIRAGSPHRLERATSQHLHVNPCPA
jgi:hypothetical protein